jgi:hypothetical protein
MKKSHGIVILTVLLVVPVLAAYLPAGPGLGGPVPGGTGVFVNGRELPPPDVQRLAALVGPIPPGRYWIDAQGNAGPEGGPATVNLAQLASRQGGGGPRPPDGPCGGHMGPYPTIHRGNEVAESCRAQGHWAGQTYHNGDGYYIDVR